ncbi:hypothetical protein IQ255_26945 [Pleurocapsales cyanobacterium LEGE 10410]|nr:hypothetical protein [Pleurocapsales cyanobacterium LEGE 10410]
MSKSEREAMFGKTESGYLWCLHCERAYKESEYRTEVNRNGDMMEMCHYEDCDGDAVIDAWDWADLKEGHPDYPDNPVEGKVYPQYG